MTPEDEKELLELGAALQKAKQSPYLARVLVGAFLMTTAREWPEVGRVKMPPLTFASWLRLEAARSPFLVDEWNEMREPANIAAALQAISGQMSVTEDWLVEHCQPGEVIGAVRKIRGVVSDAFGTALRMQHPEVKSTAAPVDHGFGAWMSLLTRMCEMLGRLPYELMDMRVDQALALDATRSYLQGCEPRGENYLEREVLVGEVGLLDHVPNVEPDGEGQAKHSKQQEADGQGEADETLAGTAPVKDPEQTGDDR